MRGSRDEGDTRERRDRGPTRPGPWARLLRRRRFIVDARFQLGLLSAFLGQMLVFALVLVLTVFVPPILTLSDPHQQPERLLETARALLALDAMLWPALGAAFVLATLLALRTSHRIAGPLYRFRRVFEALERGEDPGPVRLRRGDYLKREAALLERVVRCVLEDRERLRGLERVLEELPPEAGGAPYRPDAPLLAEPAVPDERSGT